MLAAMWFVARPANAGGSCQAPQEVLLGPGTTLLELLLGGVFLWRAPFVELVSRETKEKTKKHAAMFWGGRIPFFETHFFWTVSDNHHQSWVGSNPRNHQDRRVNLKNMRHTFAVCLVVHHLLRQLRPQPQRRLWPTGADDETTSSLRLSRRHRPVPMARRGSQEGSLCQDALFSQLKEGARCFSLCFQQIHPLFHRHRGAPAAPLELGVPFPFGESFFFQSCFLRVCCLCVSLFVR